MVPLMAPVAPPWAKTVINVARQNTLTSRIWFLILPSLDPYRAILLSSLRMVRTNFPQNLSKPPNLFYCVVMHKGCADRARFLLEPEPSHQARRIHVSVANADAGLGHHPSNDRRQNAAQIEAEGWTALADLARITNSVNFRSCLLQDA